MGDLDGMSHDRLLVEWFRYRAYLRVQHRQSRLDARVRRTFVGTIAHKTIAHNSPLAALIEQTRSQSRVFCRAIRRRMREVERRLGFRPDRHHNYAGTAAS